MKTETICKEVESVSASRLPAPWRAGRAYALRKKKVLPTAFVSQRAGGTVGVCIKVGFLPAVRADKKERGAPAGVKKTPAGGG